MPQAFISKRLKRIYRKLKKEFDDMKKTIWKVFDCLKSNERQLLQIVVLVIATIAPLFVNLRDLFKDYLESNPLSPDNFVWYIAITRGKYVASVIVFFLSLWIIRKSNSDFDMNKRNVYHDYCYVWYWFCAKVLGIKKCNLVHVPIYMQFKLVIRGTFDEFPLDEDEFPIMDNEPECNVLIINEDAYGDEINLILEDTYAIKEIQIPKTKRGLYTIKISRNNGTTNGRHFSQKFIEATINAVRGIRQVTVINIFATTNPMNTKHIAKRVFALGGRGNVEHICVFQQAGSDKRIFSSKGHKIY